MITLVVVVWVMTCILLLLHASVRLSRTRRSRFELKHRSDDETLRRERLFNDLIQLRAIVAAALLIIAVALSIVIWQAWGVLIMLAVFIAIQPLSRLSLISRLGHMLYDRWEPKILTFLDKSSFVRFILGADHRLPHDQKIESVEQLLHLVETSAGVLTDDQRTIVTHGLTWHTTPVSAIMTDVKNIVSIKHSELLGPLVLDDLHRSGHNRFPVTRGNIDTIIGVLDIRLLLDVTAGKRSETVEKTMSAQVLRIESDETLPAALHMLQKSHQHMLIIVDDDGKTVGLLTLADITGSLLG
jgi:CBS domain containing-hemolysin-like protein